MIREKKYIYLALILLACVIVLAACGGEKIPTDAILAADTNTYGDIYFYYGVVEQNGVYYVRVLREYMESPSADDYLYVSLANQLEASFQPKGWEGAWSPNVYHTANELAAADQEGLITVGIAFSSGISGGQMNYLAEQNSYPDNVMPE